jgi:hypothetical protein
LDFIGRHHGTQCGCSRTRENIRERAFTGALLINMHTHESTCTLTHSLTHTRTHMLFIRKKLSNLTRYFTHTLTRSVSRSLPPSLSPSLSRSLTSTHAHGPCTHQLPDEIICGRYHSLYAEKMPDCLEVTAKTEDGCIMGVRHKTLPIAAVQVLCVCAR